MAALAGAVERRLHYQSLASGSVQTRLKFRVEGNAGISMRKFITAAIFVQLVCGSAFGASGKSVTIDNQLAACVKVDAGKPVVTANLLRVDADFQLNSSIAECGCKSALAAYVSSVEQGGRQLIVQQGTFGLTAGGRRELVLATDAASFTDGQFTIQLACAPPA
ncbi:DUF2195 family protein [Phyllobacterium sp. 0TCS1.6C]|uniref:DUF2195 family protein n=1 Tax=unclassified Phyllobacterium TaxID=2638441 RepID=UPI0022655884|nr:MULTISPECIES: DUF2195 family protein [unclassified Phyllobacterium]MCX8281505.1 DUF2195 family protein [Phyllobacterium sp. 0TCS1.6C]MCX8292899.1 DUF2195 family protein [Phyllobacterium sp. 0TCS1.6A]